MLLETIYIFHFNTVYPYCTNARTKFTWCFNISILGKLQTKRKRTTVNTKARIYQLHIVYMCLQLFFIVKRNEFENFFIYVEKYKN